MGGGGVQYSMGGITGAEERLDCKAEEDERNFRTQQGRNGKREKKRKEKKWET